jgi:hypothetical protein
MGSWPRSKELLIYYVKTDSYWIIASRHLGRVKSADTKAGLIPKVNYIITGINRADAVITEAAAQRRQCKPVRQRHSPRQGTLHTCRIAPPYHSQRGESRTLRAASGTPDDIKKGTRSVIFRRSKEPHR